MSLRRIHGLSIAGALLLAVMPTTAFSDEAPDETGLTAGEVYDLVNDEFPGVIDTRTVDSKSTDDEVAVEAEDGSSEAFVIPADPDEPFEGPADPVEISLPETLPTND
ncbi:MAG: hypothetical protein L0H31_11085, partial [Nocardioidaceae bacterium]|nr:hypothetical protein [Nocardioidaceae bacterium]